MSGDEKRWSLSMQDDDNEVEVKFHNYTTQDGSNVSVEMGPDWKNTLHENNEDDEKDANYHESVYYKNEPYQYDDDDKVSERKTWYDDDKDISKQESYDDEGNVTDHTDDDSYDGNDGGCFLTTACIQSKNLPDNCTELMTLRNFRDTYLCSTPEGKELIDEYYRIAPFIVQKINSDKNKNKYYDEIYSTIVRCVKFINLGQNAEATNLYYEMTRSLQKQFAVC